MRRLGELEHRPAPALVRAVEVEDLVRAHGADVVEAPRRIGAAPHRAGAVVEQHGAVVQRVDGKLAVGAGLVLGPARERRPRVGSQLWVVLRRPPRFPTGFLTGRENCLQDPKRMPLFGCLTRR